MGWDPKKGSQAIVSWSFMRNPRGPDMALTMIRKPLVVVQSVEIKARHALTKQRICWNSITCKGTCFLALDAGEQGIILQ